MLDLEQVKRFEVNKIIPIDIAKGYLSKTTRCDDVKRFGESLDPLQAYFMINIGWVNSFATLTQTVRQKTVVTDNALLLPLGDFGHPEAVAVIQNTKGVCPLPIHPPLVR